MNTTALPKTLDENTFFIGEISEEDYHNNVKGKEGGVFYSASGLKTLVKCNFLTRDTKSMTLGRHQHRFIEGIFTPERPFIILGPFHKKDKDGKDIPEKHVRQGTTEFKTLVEKLKTEKNYKDNDFVVLNKTEYEAMVAVLPALAKYLKDLKHNLGESRIYIENAMIIGKEQLGLLAPISPVLQEFKKFLMDGVFTALLPNFMGYRGRADMFCMTPDKKGLHLWDWKTTSKSTMPEIKQQIRSYDYYFSLFLYATLLETIYQIPVVAINLAMIPKKAARGVFIFQTNVQRLNFEQLKGLCPFAADSNKTNHYLRVGIETFKNMKKYGYAIIKEQV